MTAEDFARAKPFSEVFPEQFKQWKNGPPARRSPQGAYRLPAWPPMSSRPFAPTGPGYNARVVEKVLRAALAKGLL